MDDAGANARHVQGFQKPEMSRRVRAGILRVLPWAGVVKLADARDSKSRGVHSPCRFDSDLRHQPSLSLHAQAVRRSLGEGGLPVSMTRAAAGKPGSDGLVALATLNDSTRP